MDMWAPHAGFGFLGKEIYWREMQFRDIAIFEECYVPLNVALYIEDSEFPLNYIVLLG